MTCSSLEFSVAQVLEHPTSVWKIDVVDSVPILALLRDFEELENQLFDYVTF